MYIIVRNYWRHLFAVDGFHKVHAIREICFRQYTIYIYIRIGISFITHIYILPCCFLCSQTACMTYLYGHKSLSYENVLELNDATQ